MNNWYNYCDEENKMVLSSRVRFARNLKNTPFPNKLDAVKGREVVKTVEDGFYRSNFTKDQYKSIYLWEKDRLDENVYFEKHLISSNAIKNRDKSAFIINNDETASIMVNEEDHIRLQCINGGLRLLEAYDMATKLDDLLEENLEYAFDEKLGYLTACPTNIGTGMRASVMIHLPGLTMNKEINGMLNVLTQVGMTIRGLYGEGSQADGNLYQISNQISLGLPEEDIITNLSAVVEQIINQEKLARENIIKTYKYELEDKINRSLGILRSAVILSSRECLNLASNVRLGAEMGIIKDVPLEVLNKLLVNIQPANLQKEFAAKMNEKERDINRAKLVKEALK